MSRSSRNQAEENRARIVEVASGLFRARGVNAVSVADVMKAAGMTQGGFHRHFENKNTLAAEACPVAFDSAVVKRLAVAETATADGQDAARALVDYYLTPKAPEAISPMIALAGDAARRQERDALRISYDIGVRRLIDTFANVAGADRNDRILKGQFARMVGANMLASSAPSGVVLRALKPFGPGAVAAG